MVNGSHGSSSGLDTGQLEGRPREVVIARSRNYVAKCGLDIRPHLRSMALEVLFDQFNLVQYGCLG